MHACLDERSQARVARMHLVRRYVRLCSLVMFGISHSNARSTVGCSRPPGKRCSLCARIRHDRAHICREDNGRGRRDRTLQRAADARHRVAKRTASWLARAHLGLDCHEFPSVFSPACAWDRLIGATAARCAVLRCAVAVELCDIKMERHRDRPPMQPHHRKAPITHAAPPAPRRVHAGPPTRPRRRVVANPATTRPQRAALAGLPAEHTSRAAVTRMASLERSPYLGTGYDGDDAAGRQSARVRPARPEVDGAARADPRRPSPRPGCGKRK